MNITEIAQSWTILEIDHEDKKYYKVFCTWTGGYLDGDRWKLNSGIEEVRQDEHNYYFIGASGSCYQCFKKSYGVSGAYGAGILNTILKTGLGKITALEDRDWINLI